MGLLELVLGLIKANSAVRQNTCIEVHSSIRDCSLSLHMEVPPRYQVMWKFQGVKNIQNVHFRLFFG